MTMFKKLTTFSIFMLIVLISVSAQKKIDLSKDLPIDKSVRIGKLENGFTYYIKRNEKPEKRVELRLAVNAGSICETDEEQGLAHFTEHMCFNGTKNFEKNELVNALETMGMKFGGDVNAYTGFDETVYMLQIPTDKPELVDKGLLIMEDWAHQVTLADDEIDKERGVIIAEWRMGLGAEDRMRKKAFPVIFKDSRYADRIPIGKVDILESFKYETIRNFYKTWYRPDLQALVIVGDIDVDAMEKKVIEQFSKIPMPENAKPRELFDIPDNDEPLISIETDEEATSNMAMFFYKHPRKEFKTLGDFREMLMHDLYNGMMNARLSELSQKADCPFMMAQGDYSSFLARNLDAYTSYGMMKENMIGEGIESIMTENMRVKQHGFTVTEFERQKDEILQYYEKAAKEDDKTNSKRFASEYVSNFLNSAPIPGAKKEFSYAKELLPEITIEEVNGLGQQWITDKNFVMMISAPKKDDVKVPTKDDVLKIVEKVKGLTLEPWVDDVANAPLVEEIPVGSKVKEKKENAVVGYTHLTLENGVNIILKPTDFKNDEIVMSSYSFGGTSHAEDNDVLSAMFSFAIVEQGGIGDISKTQLEKKLKGKDVEVMPIITENDEGFKGSCSPEDLETMLQMTYLYFTDPRKDEEAFNSFVSKMKNQMKFLGSSPMMVFQDTLAKIVTNNNPRTVAIPKPEQVDKIDLDKVFEFYTDRYADASDFYFFFVGNFDVDSITPLLETYLGGLPVKERKESFIDRKITFPEGKTEVTIQKGMDDKSMVAMVMSGKFDYTFRNRIEIKMLAEALNIKMRENLREEEGGVYTVQMMDQVTEFPTPEYKIILVYPCGPKNVKKLNKIAFAQLKKVIAEGPTDEDLAKVKETLIRQDEEKQKENGYWLNKLESGFYHGGSFDDFGKYAETVQSVTKEDIKKAAEKYITLDHYVKVVLMPEKK